MMGKGPDLGTLAERYGRVRDSIPPGVQLVAVSKTRSVEEIKALYDLGHRAFGENYPQELGRKQAILPADIEWHFIGHLQTNKVKLIAPFVQFVHAVDSIKLLDEIEKRAVASGRTIRILMQAHIAEETSKHGMSIGELRSLMRAWEIDRWPNLTLCGLMGMATLTGNANTIGKEFALLAELFRSLRHEGSVDLTTFATLSMGMSDDMDLAIREGSTMVRVGSAIFGPRTPQAT